MGYQAPPNRRMDYGFMSVEVQGDFMYCKSHKLWYNEQEQNKLLYEGKACIYTDLRFEDGFNYFKTGVLHIGRRTRGKNGKPLTLKSAIRRFNKTFNLPVGTVVNVEHNCYIPRNRRRKKSVDHSLGYKFKVKKFRALPVDFQINDPAFEANFKSDDKAKDLTDLLRANGFLVQVYYVPEEKYTYSPDGGSEPEHEFALAYGHGLRIGFASEHGSVYSYSDGYKNLLFDYWEWFDKWSRCELISKTTPNQEILDILLKRSVEMKKEDEEMNEKYNNLYGYQLDKNK